MSRSFPIILFFFSPFAIRAQTLTQHVLASAGTDFTGTGLHLSATIGETSVQTYSFGNTMLSQGFQQPSGPGSPLPLNWLSFTATLIDGQTHLEWNTAQEFHNDHFEVQKAADGSDFISILAVRSKGDSWSAQTYAATDPAPFPGKTWYRVRQVDLDGHFTYSPVAEVQQIAISPGWMAYPNPVIDELVTNITLDAPQSLLLDLYDMNGRLLISQQIKGASGANRISWNLHALAPGIYLLQCRNKDLPTIKINKK